MEKPLVSVYCLAYNHEKYIKTALEGFVKQKTQFSYEVIVHDDASTDGTADIIKEYAENYPDIIKPIFQRENQYSKGISFIHEIIYPYIRGKYVAVCEGDDYWCDENKLQRQVDWMENHPEYVFCGHNTLIINQNTGEQRCFCKESEDRDVSMNDLLKKPRPFFHTSSFLFRTEYWNVPLELQTKEFGDYPRAIYMCLSGKVRYLHEVMSVYRLYAEDSWSTKTDHSPESKKRTNDLFSALLQLLDNLNAYTNGDYNIQITNLKTDIEYKMLLNNEEYETIIKYYKKRLNQEKIIKRFKIHAHYRFPGLIRFYRRIKGIKS